MADIVGSLFGLSVPELEAQRRQKQMEENQQYASMMAKGSIAPARAYNKAMLGRSLGQALGGALFGVKDPMIERATQLEGILKSTQDELGAEASDPYKLYNTLSLKLGEAGFNREAMQAKQLGGQAQKEQVDLAVKSSQIAENLAKARKEDVLKDSKMIAWQSVAAKSTPESVDASVKAGYDFTKLIIKETEKNITAENKAETAKLDKFISDFGPVIGNDKFLEWKQTQAIEQKKAGKTDINLPSEGSKTEDVVRIEKSWRDNVGPAEAKLGNIKDAIRLANLAQTNPSASNLLDTEIAQLAQGGKLSNKDVDLVRSGNASVFQRFGDKIGIFFSGKQTDLTLKDKIEIIKAYEAGAAKSYNDASERTANIWSTSPIGKDTITQLRKGRQKYVVGGGMTEQLDPNFDYVKGTDGVTYRKPKAKQ